jgi:hypothetical protein
MEKQYIAIQETLKMVIQGELGEWGWSKQRKHCPNPRLACQVEKKKDHLAK